MAFKIYNGPVKRTIKTETISPSVLCTCTVTNVDQPPGTTNTTVFRGSLPASTRFYDSTSVAGWRQLIADGFIINNPFTTMTSTFSHVPADFRDSFWQEASWWKHWYNDLNGLVASVNWQTDFPAIPSDEAARQRALDESVTRAFAKANSGSAALLVDLFQLKELVGMFVGALRTLLALVKSRGAFVDIVTAISRHSNRDVRTYPLGREALVRSLSGLWCEMRFGWRPLLGTLDGIVEALQSLERKTKRVTYRASETYTFEKEETLESIDSQLGFSLPIRKTIRVSNKSTFRAGILLEEDPDLLKALGLEWKQLPYALWDVVPFSFIWDRFVNVGDFIRSLHPIPKSRFCGAWVVEKFERSLLRQCEFVAGDQSSGSGPSYRRWARTGAQSTVLEQVTGYQRIPVLSPPLLPVLRHDWREFQNLYNLIDVLMLAIQRVPKGHL